MFSYALQARDVKLKVSDTARYVGVVLKCVIMVGSRKGCMTSDKDWSRMPFAPGTVSGILRSSEQILHSLSHVKTYAHVKLLVLFQKCPNETRKEKTMDFELNQEENVLVIIQGFSDRGAVIVNCFGVKIYKYIYKVLQVFRSWWEWLVCTDKVLGGFLTSPTIPLIQACTSQVP